MKLYIGQTHGVSLLPKFLLFLSLFLVFFGPAHATAFEDINTGYFDDLALQGYDTTLYYSRGSVKEGKTSLSFTWKGAEWRFATEKSRDLFAANPSSYAPQYGGYCSNQMSLGNLSDIDPGVWLIHDTKLFFFGHKEGKDRWEKTGIAARIADADRHWKEYLTK